MIVRFHLLEIKIYDDGAQMMVKNNYWQVFQIKLDECYIFQKLTSQEKIILKALDFLEKK